MRKRRHKKLQVQPNLAMFLARMGFLHPFARRPRIAPPGVFLCLKQDFRMTRPTLPWTRQGRFLRTLAKTGNVALACRSAGIDRRLAYRWRARAPGFARRWKEALARATELLRDEVMERALVGRERFVYRYRPTVAHRQVRRELLAAQAAAPPAPRLLPGGLTLAEALREAEVRVARYEAERAVALRHTHSKT